MGYDARWGVLGACHAGAPHRRERIWILATNSNRNGEHDGTLDAEVAGASQSVADADEQRLGDLCNNGSRSKRGETQGCEQFNCHGSGGQDVADANGRQMGRVAESWDQCRFWESEPGVGRVANGVANRVDRLRALGNGQVPAVAALAWRILNEGELEIVPRRMTRKQILEELLS
jgi:DNA (cytosine-5)-methyltransferase 1